MDRAARSSDCDERLIICGAVWKKTICFVKHVFWAYLDHNLSDIYIGNIRFIYRTNCALSRTRKHAQNKSDKIVFSKWRATRRLEKNDFVMHVFSTYLDHNLSDIYIGNIRLIYWTNCNLSRTKKHAQNKSDKTFCLTYFVRYGSYELSQTKSRSITWLSWCAAQKAKIINLEVSLNGLSRSSVIKAPNLKVVFVWHTKRVASKY